MLITLFGLRYLSQKEDTGFSKLKDLPKATKLVFSKLPFVFITLGACLDAFIVSSSVAFTPKIIETQFYLPPGRSALLYGLISVPMALVGNLVGKQCVVCGFL